MEERLAISVDEAAKMLGISRNNAYVLIKKGEIPAVKLGERRTVVPLKALRAMMGEGENEYKCESR